MKVRGTGKLPDKVQMQMAPMIDVVFQLLVFFIMTFKIVTLEGDFNIRMPLAAVSEGPVSDVLPPIRLRLASGPDGELTGIRMGEEPLSSFAELHEEILAIVGTDTGPGSLAESAEVELDVDYNLKYEYVIEAVTAVSGRIDRNNRIIRLIEKIKFAPPREPDEGQ